MFMGESNHFGLLVLPGLRLGVRFVVWVGLEEGGSVRNASSKLMGMDLDKDRCKLLVPRLDLGSRGEP